MADFNETMQTLSPDNRLTFDQFVGMTLRMKDRYNVSDTRAMNMVQETLKKRQELLDERVKASGGKSWDEIRKHPQADGMWKQWMNRPEDANQ